MLPSQGMEACQVAKWNLSLGKSIFISGESWAEGKTGEVEQYNSEAI